MAVREPVDFDAAWAEMEAQAGPAPSIKIRGEVVTLPRSLPASVVLYGVRNRARLEGAAPDPEGVNELAGLLFGAERVAGWVDDGMTMAALYTAYLLAKAAMYQAKKDPEGEAQPPATGASSTTSSPDGSPSKATSNASTVGT